MGLGMYVAAPIMLPLGYFTPIISGTGFLFGAQAFSEMLSKYRRNQVSEKAARLSIRGLLVAFMLGTIAIFTIPNQYAAKTKRAEMTSEVQERKPIDGLEVGILRK